MKSNGSVLTKLKRVVDDIGNLRDALGNIQCISHHFIGSAMTVKVAPPVMGQAQDHGSGKPHVRVAKSAPPTIWT